MSNSNLLMYRTASKPDCDRLATFINNCYRGELAAQGWTNENDLIHTPRTNTTDLCEMMDEENCLFLLYFGENDQILKGCINLLYKSQKKTVHLSLFCVRPDLQNQGYGKSILSTAEDFAMKKWNVEHFALNVIIQRTELVSYYNRRGYVDTGQRESLTFETSNSNDIPRNDLEIGTLRKSLTIHN